MPSSPSLDNRWTFCGDKVPKQEVVFISQIIASFIIVIVALLNLSLTDRNKELWSALVGAGFGYLVPNPTFQRRRRHHQQQQQLPPSHESLYYDAAEQQLDELQSEQHGVTIHDETE